MYPDGTARAAGCTGTIVTWMDSACRASSSPGGPLLRNDWRAALPERLCHLFTA